MWTDKELFKWFIFLLPVIVAKAPDFIHTFGAKDQSMHFGKLNAGSEKNVFKIDTANLTVNKMPNTRNLTIDILYRSDECYKCAYYSLGILDHHHFSKSIFVDTRWGSSIKLLVTDLNCSAKVHYFFGEYGHYSVNFTANLLKNGSSNCFVSSIYVNKSPQNSNLPILVAFLILLVLGLLYSFGLWLYEKKMRSNSAQLLENDFGISNNVESDDTVKSTANTRQPQRRERLKSIDTFRGLCIVIMIFVNYKGGYYWFFRHSSWNGLTVADLVFPWFMFIMGVNITLSIESLLNKNTPSREIAYKVIRRTIILFALGAFIINHNTAWYNFRVPGVLQRFAISYLFAFLIQWPFHKSPTDLRERARVDDTPTWWYPLRDIILYWPQWIIVFALEALWLSLTFALPIPGCTTGYIGAGGLADNGHFINSSCIGGAAGYIDKLIFGEKHIYGHPTAMTVYYPTTTEAVPYDPEGLLGSIHSCLIVFLGSQMGKIFLYYETPKSRVVRWFCWGMFFGVISLILCRASANEGWIPVNKNLWTTTFVTTLSCFAFLLMIVIYWLVDVLKWWTGAPLYFVGMNSILVYVGHETFQSYTPFSWGATEHSTHAEWLAMNMLGVFYWILIAYYCFKIKFFVKI